MSEERNEYTPDLYTLVDEDGNEQTFEMLDVMEVDDQLDFALIPYQADPESMIEDDGELVILKSEMVDGEEMLVSIEDEDEFDRIGELFLKRLDEIYEDCDCEDDDCNCGCCDHDHLD